MTPQRRPAAERINETAPVAPSDGDWTTGPEGLAVLRSRGVDAWQVWIAEQQAKRRGEVT